MKKFLNHELVRFILDGLTAIIIVAGLLFIYWGLSTLPMHRYPIGH